MISTTTLISVLLISLNSVLSQGTTSPAPTTSSPTTSSSTATTTSSSSGSKNSLTAGLSTECQAAAGGLLSSDFSSCANIIGLVSVLGATGSVLSPLESWISGICSSSPCSSSTLSTASSSINSGCSGDVSKNVPSAIALNTVINNYQAVRNMICTQYSGNSTFCVPYVLGNIQTATGKMITLGEVQGLVTSGLGSLSLSNVPSGTYCNDCGHAIFTQSAAISVSTSSANNLTVASTGASSSLTTTCGAGFGDGKIPSAVRIAGSGGASGNAKNGDGNQDRVSGLKMMVFGLIGVVGICMV